MWTERDIREQTDEQTFYRGKLLESTNGVLELSSFETEGVYGDKELNLRATIHGTNKNNYKVEVTLYYDEYGEPQDIDYYCPCEDFLTSDGICKHCVATILYYMHTDRQSKTVTSPCRCPLHQNTMTGILSMGTLPPFLLKTALFHRKVSGNIPPGQITVCSRFSASSAIRKTG